MPSDNQSVITPLQHEVQRKLGRSLCQLQTFENLLKVVLTHMELSGPLSNLEGVLQARGETFKNKTLGVLAGSFVGDYLVPFRSERAQTKEDLADTITVPWLSFRSQRETSPEEYEARKRALAEMVALRNELVHHFVERFDLWSEEGCHAASSYLDASHQTILQHYQLLTKTAEMMDNAWQMLASELSKQAFKDCLLYGINPDGSVTWDAAPIVYCLREAESAHAIAGWTELNKAIAFVRQKNRDLIPRRYGCSSWRQVLHESKLFEIRKESPEKASPVVVWYRSRVELVN